MSGAVGRKFWGNFLAGIPDFPLAQSLTVLDEDHLNFPIAQSPDRVLETKTRFSEQIFYNIKKKFTPISNFCFLADRE